MTMSLLAANNKSKRKPGDHSGLNDLICAMRKKGRSFADIAKEVGESKWYVRQTVKIHLTHGEQEVARVVCKDLAGKKGAQTQARRRKIRSLIGDVEYHVAEEDGGALSKRIRVPIPKHLGVRLNLDLMYRVKDMAERDRVKMSQLLYPLLQIHLAAAEAAIEADIRKLLK